jgi:hypothetical protein
VPVQDSAQGDVGGEDNRIQFRAEVHAAEAEADAAGSDPPPPDVDIDLTDPEVAMAATKIQSSFRGQQARKQFAQMQNTSHVNGPAEAGESPLSDTEDVKEAAGVKKTPGVDLMKLDFGQKVSG